MMCECEMNHKDVSVCDVQVNGHDLSAASHEEARLILQTALTFDVSALTVYREKAGHLIDSASKEGGWDIILVPHVLQCDLIIRIYLNAISQLISEILKISLRKEGGRLGVILIGRE